MIAACSTREWKGAIDRGRHQRSRSCASSRRPPKHDAAHARVVALAESPSRWAIPVFCIGEFVRVITHPRLFHAPHTAEEACEALSCIWPVGAIEGLLIAGPVSQWLRGADRVILKP